MFCCCIRTYIHMYSTVCTVYNYSYCMFCVQTYEALFVYSVYVFVMIMTMGLVNSWEMLVCSLAKVWPATNWLPYYSSCHLICGWLWGVYVRMYILTFAFACYLCSRCSLTWRGNALECPKGFVSGRPVMMWCLLFVVVCVLWVGVVWSAIHYFLATAQISLRAGSRE